MAERMPDVKIEGAQIIFRNFEGKEGPYNRKGDRNFAVILDNETADLMARDGWNVRTLEPREEGDEPLPYLGVTVRFDVRPPKVILLTSTSRTVLNEDSVEVLDSADIKNADLIISPYQWAVNDKSGIKAYLKTLYVELEEDDLDRKYASYGMSEGE